MMLNWWNSILIAALIISAGAVSVYAMGASLANIASLIFGFIWGFIIPRILDRGFRNEIMFKNKLYRLLRLRPADILGFPDSVETGIMYYRARRKLPLEELLSQIDERMDMLAISFTVIIQNIDTIRNIVASGKKMTFLVLNPDSEFVNLHAQLYSDGRNLDTQIETSLGALLKLRDDFPDNHYDL